MDLNNPYLMLFHILIKIKSKHVSNRINHSDSPGSD